VARNEPQAGGVEGLLTGFGQKGAKELPGDPGVGGSTFVRALAHQIRNPLFGLSAMLDVLEMERAVDMPLHSKIGELRAQVARIDRILEALTDLVAENPRPGRRTCVSETVEEAVRAVQPAAELQGVVVRSSFEDRQAVVVGEAASLRRAWQALIEQAVSQSPRGGEVRVRVTRGEADGRATVEVSVFDGGGGFGVLPDGRAFEPFSLRRRGDTGLELAAARRTVLGHGGSVVARALEGGGSVFEVRLPRVTEDRER
jgi:signal transduction histidine kinase